MAVLMENLVKFISNDMVGSIAAFKRYDLVEMGTVTADFDAKDMRHYGAKVGTMKRCPACSAWVFSNCAFCPGCGHKFENEEDEDKDPLELLLDESDDGVMRL